MLVLLPPSEGKATPPARGPLLDVAGLSFPELSATRRRVLAALLHLCRGDPQQAASVLRLGPSLSHLVGVNAGLDTGATVPARSLYTGVLYGALGLGRLPRPAAARASRDLLIASGLWGLVRTGDRVPAYRLPGGVSLPGLGPLARVWREPLRRAIPGIVDRGPLLDLRSGTYAAAWTPRGDIADQTVTVRVLSERDGRRIVVSEANKALKGRLTRALLLSERRSPSSSDRLVQAITELGEHPPPGVGGWRTEGSRRVPGRSWQLDLVTDVAVQSGTG